MEENGLRNETIKSENMKNVISSMTGATLGAFIQVIVERMIGSWDMWINFAVIVCLIFILVIIGILSNQNERDCKESGFLKGIMAFLGGIVVAFLLFGFWFCCTGSGEPEGHEPQNVTVSPSPTVTQEPTLTPTVPPTPTVADTPTPTPTNTPVPTATSTPTPTATCTPTPLPKYEVMFDSNGGSEVESKIVTYGESLSAFSEPTREHYSFSGWTYNGQRVNTINVEHNMTLVATWVPNSYMVTFDGNGGFCATGNKQVSYAGTYGNLPTPTRENYTFEGWYTAKSGGTKITDVSTVDITENVVLYAQWTPYKTMYVYYHYTNGNVGEFSVCPYSGANSAYGWIKSEIYREEIWLDEPLKKNSKTYYHKSTEACQQFGCMDGTWSDHPYYDENYATNKVIWYNQATILVPASTEEGVRR